MTEQEPTPKPGVAVVGGPARKGGDDAVEAGAPAGASAPQGGRRSRARTVAPRGRGTPTWVTVVFGVVALVAIVVAIAFGSAWSNLNSQNTTRDTVKRVGTDFLMALTNFSPTTVDADFRTIATYATGSFAQQSNAFFGSSIRQQLQAVQAKSQGQIRYIYVQSLEGNSATLYAEVDQTFANS
ncbi:MAG TPA: hypothetical protein VE991_11655, partial [Acidimicrobiales bacterium]|nr:hypothetical protein [Acidimicrobiales bacterium]